MQPGPLGGSEVAVDHDPKVLWSPYSLHARLLSLLRLRHSLGVCQRSSLRWHDRSREVKKRGMRCFLETAAGLCQCSRKCKLWFLWSHRLLAVSLNGLFFLRYGSEGHAAAQDPHPQRAAPINLRPDARCRGLL